MQGWQKNRTNPDCNSWKVSSGDTGLKAILTLLLLSLVTDVLHLKQHSKRNLFLSNEYLFLWLRRESWWPHRKRVHCPGHCVVFLGKGHILMVPLSSQIYQWVLADEPIQGRFSKILLDLSCHRNQNWAPTYRLLGFKNIPFLFLYLSRRLDGTSYNKDHVWWGAAMEDVTRDVPAMYPDGIALPSGTCTPEEKRTEKCRYTDEVNGFGSHRPPPRKVSNSLFQQVWKLTWSGKCHGSFVSYRLYENSITTTSDIKNIMLHDCSWRIWR